MTTIRAIVWCRYVCILCFLFNFSCNTAPRELAPEKYMRWVSSHDSGLIRTKRVNNLNITVRYMPPAYLAYKEFRNNPSESFDSIMNAYKCGTTFQIILQADKIDANYGRLLMYNASSQEEVMQRIRVLSFNMDEFVYLKHNDEVLRPVLSNFEGYDEIGNRISFQVVFIVPQYNCGVIQKELGDLQLSFEDPFWDTGTNHFLLQKKLLVDIPTIKI